MLDMTDAMEDPPSQDAKTLVPMSLSLVAKKEKILQAEVDKLEKLLSQRNKLLCDLRENHEYILTTNGQLQERKRLRKEKLVSLRTLLEADHERDGAGQPGHCDAIGVSELDATAEKCDVLKNILLGLTDKHTALEKTRMGLEERTAIDTAALRGKKEQLNEVQSTLFLLHEDIRSTQWNFENDQAEFTEEDKRLNAANQDSQRETSKLDKIDAAFRMEKITVADLQTVWKNCQGMAHEEHRQLAVANEEAKSEQRELQKLLDNNGATCPADEEVLQEEKELQSRLQHLNEEVTNAKFLKRELALRRKQEKDMLVITQSSIKAKDEHLTWLERQRIHLENERNEIAKAQAADEAAYRVLVEEHEGAMAALNAQIKDAEKQMKTTERVIPAQIKKVDAVNKKIAQKTKQLAEWRTIIDAKQEEVAKSAATQELVDAEALSIQEALDQELRLLQNSQQLRATQEMETEELRSSWAALDTDTRQVRKTLAATKNRLTETQTAVKNRIDEIREKFLSSFVISDAENLIELLNEEIEKRDKDALDSAIASKGEMLKQRYDALAADTRTKYGKILRQKERKYNTKLRKLRNLEAASTDITRMGEEEDIVERESATGPSANRGQESMAPEQVSKAKLDGVPDKAPVVKKRLSITKPTQPKAKVVSKQAVPKRAPKSARRQLAPGLYLADESPRTDNELTDIFTANAETASSARRPRLKRRTPAQKAGKAATAEHNHPESTPEKPAPVTIASSASSAQSDPAGGSDPVDFPVGCDENLDVAVEDNTTHPVTTIVDTEAPSLSSQAAAKNQPKQKVAKRRTKVSHRHVKAAKIGRLSLARSSVDWSTSDAFSFN